MTKTVIVEAEAFLFESKKQKRRGLRRASLFWLIPSPRYLPKTFSYCNAIYWPAVVLGAAPIVLHPARISPGAAIGVTDELNLTTASGFEQKFLLPVVVAIGLALAV